jgi:hypothetical protein
MSDDSYKWVTEYPIEVYKCGLRAGDRLRLKNDLPIVDHTGSPSGKVHKRGETWTVKPGAKEEVVVVWLSEPDGNLHTWDDTSEIFEWFERIE